MLKRAESSDGLNRRFLCSLEIISADTKKSLPRGQDATENVLSLTSADLTKVEISETNKQRASQLVHHLFAI